MKRSTEGAYTITSRGVETSSASRGAAISKAITIASRIQREGELEEGDTQSVYVRLLGGDAVARVDITPDMIKTYALG